MKRFGWLVVLAFVLAGMSAVWADAIPQVVTSTTQAVRTRVVFNDAGSALTSGQVVIWDNDDTEFDRSGYPYVTTTTVVDDDWTAGVVFSPSCADQSLCEIVVEGPVITLIADTTDDATEDTLVGTSGTAGMAGDYGTGANTCALGILMENRSVDTAATTATQQNGVRMWVFVDPACN